MKNNFKLFAVSCLLWSAGIFLGSIPGHAVNQVGLFIGAFVGGICGILLAALMMQKWKVIQKDRFFATIIWGIVFLGTASLFAVTNLNSPVIPLISILFVGLGCVVGNSFASNAQRHKRLYLSLSGFVLIVPTLYFVIGSIVKYNLGFSDSFTLLDWLQRSPAAAQQFNIVSPFVFIGGTMLAILMNVPVSFKLNTQQIISIGHISVSKINIVIAVLSAFLLSMLMLYLLIENV